MVYIWVYSILVSDFSQQIFVWMNVVSQQHIFTNCEVSFFLNLKKVSITVHDYRNP